MLIYKKFNDRKVFFMTLNEIENYYNNNYNEILRVVFYIEFNSNLDDNNLIRQEILQKIKI
jgi:hypothetical protein